MIESKMCTMVVKPKTEKTEAPPTSSTKTRCRKWTEEEVSLYAAVLADNKYGFAGALESLAAKKSSNTDLFMHVKHVLDQALKDGGFKESNGKKRYRATNSMKSYEVIDTSVEKLRKKYSNLKSEWRRRSELAKTTGGIDLEREPRWFAILNSVFGSIGMSETSNDYSPHARYNLTYTTEPHNGDYLSDVHPDCNYEHSREEGIPIIHSRDEEMPMMHSRDEDIPVVHSVGERMEKYITSTSTQTDLTNETDKERMNNDEIVSTNSRKVPRTIIRIGHSPHRKRKLISSPMQALCDIAKGMQELASSQLKINKLVVENELKRDEMFYRFCTEQAEKNRAHELHLTELYSELYSKSKELPKIPRNSMHSQINKFTSPRRHSMILDRTHNECHIPPTMQSDSTTDTVTGNDEDDSSSTCNSNIGLT